MADFRDVWPAARQRQVTDFAIERVGSAMHASLPGAYAMRPEATTRLRNLFLAGDWVRHEVKPSMEGAAVSARCAADALLRSMNQRGVALLKPPEGNFTLAVRRVRKMLSARRVTR
jgi:hypothetical protein